MVKASCYARDREMQYDYLNRNNVVNQLVRSKVNTEPRTLRIVSMKSKEE